MASRVCVTSCSHGSRRPSSRRLSAARNSRYRRFNCLSAPAKDGSRSRSILGSVLPARDETSGLAFQYDRPGSEPPQTWLLVTPPRMDGTWQWSDLLGALEDTFALAKVRAVEPTQIDATPYARFLPATTSAVTLHGLSIAANYARVNDVNAFITRRADG
jgi:hypothetical protein